MTKRITALIVASLFALPLVVSAAGAGDAPKSFSELAAEAKCDPAIAGDTAFQIQVKNSFRALIKAEEKDRLRPEIHEEDAKLMVTNKRHVIMAYAAILSILVLFVVILFTRQKKFVAEIASLREDLDSAIKE
jgi:hypothetical protein